MFHAHSEGGQLVRVVPVETRRESICGRPKLPLGPQLTLSCCFTLQFVDQLNFFCIHFRPCDAVLDFCSVGNAFRKAGIQVVLI